MKINITIKKIKMRGKKYIEKNKRIYRISEWKSMQLFTKQPISSPLCRAVTVNTTDKLKKSLLRHLGARIFLLLIVIFWKKKKHLLPKRPKQVFMWSWYAHHATLPSNYVKFITALIEWSNVFDGNSNYEKLMLIYFRETFGITCQTQAFVLS